MTCNNISCFLVSAITQNTTSGTYNITFTTTPTVTDRGCFKFRIPCNITTVATAGTPLTTTVNINGTATDVPLWDCLGNVLRTGCKLKTRTCYLAQFGNDPNHIIVKDVKNV